MIDPRKKFGHESSFEVCKMLGCLKCKYENCIFIRERLRYGSIFERFQDEKFLLYAASIKGGDKRCLYDVTMSHIISFVSQIIKYVLSCNKKAIYLTHYKTPPIRNLCLELSRVYVLEWRTRQQFFSLVTSNEHNI